MLAAALTLAAVCLADVPRGGEADLAAYRDARAKAGRSAEAQIDLALWCESHGLSAERIEHLSRAIAADPANAVARALLGMVREGNRWRLTDHLTRDEKEAEAFAEYSERRLATPATAEAQWKLSSWCDKRGLSVQAGAHAAAVLRNEPNHAAARKRLGFKKVRGRWMTDADVAAEAKEAEAQRAADRKWRPRFEKWRDDLRDKRRHHYAEAALAKVTDPRAVASIVRVFSTDDSSDQRRLVQLLGQIQGGPASRLLATAALSATTPEVRRLAAETLARRDPRDFLSEVIDQIRDLVKYQILPVAGIGSEGVLLIEGEQYNVRRRYDTPALPALTLRMMEQRMVGLWSPLQGEDLPFRLGDSVPVPSPFVNAGGGDADRIARMRVISEGRRDLRIANDVAEARKAAGMAQEQMDEDVARIEARNRVARAMNDRVMTVLTAATEVDNGPDRETWHKWWTDRRGYAYVSPPRQPKPTFDQQVPANFQPAYATVSHSACFVAGTPVKTRNGPRAIESLQVGDEVLAQDVVSGRLGFEPVVAVYHNPPSATVQVATEEDSLVATGIHRFWAVGKGWVMARDLRPGDLIRTVGGASRVMDVSPRAIQPVFNLEVAKAKTFFVGKAGALVHDFSLVEPTPEPFDAPAAGQD